MVVQGNCHMCQVPKYMMDDLDSVFQARLKENMFKKVKDALNGIYPGWEEDRRTQLQKSRKDLNLSGDKAAAPVSPLPLIKKDGTLVKSRKETAGSRIGRHIMVTFFDDLDKVDLHFQVILNVIFVIVIVYTI